MSKLHIHFYMKLAVLSVLVFAAWQALGIFSGFQLHIYTVYAQLFNIVLTVASYHILTRGAQLGGFDFLNHFFANSGLRLLITASVIVWYIFVVAYEKRLFVMTFMVFYFIYSTFEIKEVLSIMRKNLDRGGNDQ